MSGLLLSTGSFAASSQPRIIGGTPASPDDYSWTAALVYQSAANALSGLTCGGTLIHQQWILTAAHCFADEYGNILNTPDLDAILGRQALLDVNGVRIRPDFMVAHPQWADANDRPYLPPRNDILLLHLPQPLTWITPVRLPGPTFDAFSVTNAELATAIGWGVTNPRGYLAASSLRFVELPIVDQAQCQQALPSLPLLDTSLCAGPLAGGQDTCYGDSGGPLLVRRGSDAQWTQVGITSYGQGECAEPGKYGVYTRVSRYAQWISDTACSQWERPARPTLRLTLDGQRASATIDPLANATGYRLFYAPAPAMTPIQSIDLAGTLGFTTELASGTDLFVAVQAYQGICLSPYSEILRLTLP